MNKADIAAHVATLGVAASQRTKLKKLEGEVQQLWGIARSTLPAQAPGDAMWMLDIPVFNRDSDTAAAGTTVWHFDETSMRYALYRCVRDTGPGLKPLDWAPLELQGMVVFPLRGLPGPAGAQGPSGPSGVQGPPGPEGARGVEGPMGPQGPAGPAGPAGPTGSSGPQGPTGSMGLTGPAGRVGDRGPEGAVGPTGPMGPVGPQGQKGDAGPQGLQGEGGGLGPQGLLGPVGPAGPQGFQGLKGDVGPQGPTGPAGAEGPVGPAGPQGPIGPNCLFVPIATGPGSVVIATVTGDAGLATQSTTRTDDLVGASVSPWIIAQADLADSNPDGGLWVSIAIDFPVNSVQGLQVPAVRFRVTLTGTTEADGVQSYTATNGVQVETPEVLAPVIARNPQSKSAYIRYQAKAFFKVNARSASGEPLRTITAITTKVLHDTGGTPVSQRRMTVNLFSKQVF